MNINNPSMSLLGEILIKKWLLYAHQKTYRETFVIGPKLEMIHLCIYSDLDIFFFNIWYIYIFQYCIAMTITEVPLHAVIWINFIARKLRKRRQTWKNQLYCSIYTIKTTFIFMYIQKYSGFLGQRVTEGGRKGGSGVLFMFCFLIWVPIRYMCSLWGNPKSCPLTIWISF